MSDDIRGHNAAWEHGTKYGYDKKGCRCGACRAFNAASWRMKAANRSSREVPKHLHGTLNAYNNYHCHCGPCRHANAVRSQQIRDESKAVAS